MYRSNIHAEKKHTAFIVLAMLLLVFSSCPVKNTVKSYFATPANGMQHGATAKAGKQLLTPTLASCMQLDLMNDATTSLHAFVSDTASSPLFLLAVICGLAALLLGFKHVLTRYHSPSSSFTPIPLFLRHRQLLL